MTSRFDWISPVLGESLSLSPNRAERTRQIFDRLRSPAARFSNDILFGNAPDGTDFRNIGAAQFRQISWLAPSPFMLHSPRTASTRYRFFQGPTRNWSGPSNFADPATSPAEYEPRLDRVGNVLNRKIMVASGTRYHTNDFLLDFDIAHDPRSFGSFTEAPAVFNSSTAWGRTSNGANSGEGWKFSFRYPGKKLVAAFFDGSAGNLSQQEAYSDASRWYPTGSTWTGVGATPEAAARYRNGDRID
jgi:hypothetical protein